MLTRREIDTLGDPGEFRKDGLEFAAIRSPEVPVEELTLVVRLPSAVACDPTAVGVFTAGIDGRGGWRRHDGLNLNVQSFGRGYYHLRIPYPARNRWYALAWPVWDGESAPDIATCDWEDSQTAEEVTTQVRQILRAQNRLPEDTAIGVYRLGRGRNVLVRECGDGVDSLDLNERSGVIRGAWWGETRVIEPEQEDVGTLGRSGERYVAFGPIRQPGSYIPPSAALVRVALGAQLLGQAAGKDQAAALKFAVDSACSMCYQRLCEQPRS